MGSQLWPVTLPTPPIGCSGGISPSLTFQRSVMVRSSTTGFCTHNQHDISEWVACFTFNIFRNYKMFILFHFLVFILATVNVLVPHCKIYNDASCDISADGQLLAVFIPSSQRGFADEGILAVYSLAPHNLGEMLYTKRFGQCYQQLSSSIWQ